MRYESVAGLVIRDDLLLLLGDDTATTLGTRDDSVDGLLELGHRYLAAREASSQKRGFVDDVREIRSGEPRSPLREGLDIDVLRQRLTASVDLQYTDSAVQVLSLIHI